MEENKEHVESLNIKLFDKKYMPEYKTKGSAGADLKARGEFIINPGTTALIPTGVFFEIPNGHEIQIRPRSGLAAKYGITVLNTPGTIDSDYRGEIKVILINHSKEPFRIKDGDRVAQMIYAPVLRAAFIPVDNLSETNTGDGGCGSTGV